MAHPFDYLRGKTSEKEVEKALDKVDIVEVINAKNSESNDKKAYEIAREKGKLFGAGSDSHQISRVFDAYMEVEEFDLDNPREFLSAIKKWKPILKKRRTIKEWISLRIKRIIKTKI